MKPLVCSTLTCQYFQSCDCKTCQVEDRIKKFGKSPIEELEEYLETLFSKEVMPV